MRTPPFGPAVSPGWFTLAAQALIFLDAMSDDESCPSGVLADRVHAHAGFLRRVLAPLARAGVVEAREGRIGGYRLARPADRITLADIYRALADDATSGADLPERPEGLRESGRGPALPLGTRNALGEVGEEVEQALLATLQRRTLAQLAHRADELGGHCAPPAHES